MRTRLALTLLSLAALPLGGACGQGAEAEPPSASLGIRVAPLDLQGIGDACYGLSAYNDADPRELVWTRPQLCASRFGNAAGGDIAYVGPCDADADADGDGVALHRIDLTLTGLYAAPYTDGAVPLSDFVNPCPAATPCALYAPCVENADTPVAFNLTILRSAQQGFFDVAVDFNNIFCSAKYDCGDTDGPRPLLHDASGTRRPTHILALACTAGRLDDDVHTTLHLSDLVLTCTGASPSVTTIDPTSGHGNLCDPGDLTASAPPPSGCAPGASLPAGGPLFQAAIYRGTEDLPDISKVFVNLALGLSTPAADTTCQLALSATADDLFDPSLVAGAIPADTVYPYITVDVPDLFACTGNHPINGPDSYVQTAYSELGGAPVAFSSQLFGFDGSSPATAARTCLDILAADSAAPSGAYWLDPYDSGDPVQIFCDMETDGGGWTLIAARNQYGAMTQTFAVTEISPHLLDADQSELNLGVAFQAHFNVNTFMTTTGSEILRVARRHANGVRGSHDFPWALRLRDLFFSNTNAATNRIFWNTTHNLYWCTGHGSWCKSHNNTAAKWDASYSQSNNQGLTYFDGALMVEADGGNRVTYNTNATNWLQLWAR